MSQYKTRHVDLIVWFCIRQWCYLSNWQILKRIASFEVQFSSVHTNVRYAHSHMGNITTFFILISPGHYHHFHHILTWTITPPSSSYSHLGKGAWSLQIRPGHLFCSLWVTVQHLWTSKKMFTKTEINVITWMGFQPSSSAMFSMRYTT